MMVKIRQLKEKDLEKIAHYEKEIFKNDSFSLDTLEKFKRDKYFIGLVAEEESEIVGYLFVSYFGNESNILKIAVDRFYRKQGIAKKLLTQMIDELREICVENLFLEVDENNEPAINLYRAFGFEKTRIRYAYYKDGANAIEMIKKI